MTQSDPKDEKLDNLRQHHALNPRPQRVTDPNFTSGDPFFDARDLVQVKYEMLRRVSREGRPASRAAQDFGFSRPSFYQAQEVIDHYRTYYNQRRPHSALRYLCPHDYYRGDPVAALAARADACRAAAAARQAYWEIHRQP